MHTSNFTFRPLFDISIIYAKYLEHSSVSAAEIIINITLVKDFVTFIILNCKNYLTCQSNYNLTTETQIYQNKVYWQGVF